ncbi:MAG: protein jag [Clostridiales bacterium]|nr:protein jag [Clostridiales bacterium]
MKSVEVQEKTVELAIEKGLQQLGCSIDKVETEVLSAGGLFTKAKVRLIKKDTVGEKAQSYLEGFFKIIRLGALIDVEENDEEAVLNIVGTDLSLLYENNGEVFDALQYLTALSANKDSLEYKRVVLESEDFRARREEELQEYAQAMAQKAVKTNRRIKLEPMNPYKRRVIHTKLQSFPGVTTHSEGDEPYRAIVITPTNSRPKFNRKPNRRKNNNRKNYKNGQQGGKNYGAKSRPGAGGFNGSRTQKPSGFTTGTLIKRNSFESE